MFVFAAMSFYWAAGGMAGAETLGTKISELAHEREPGFVATLWITAVVKLLGGGFALALARPWRHRRLLLVVAWAVAGFLLLYGLANFVQHGLMQAGVVDVPAGLGGKGVRWHLALWDPFWTAGGVLLALAAAQFARRPA
jgi:hypothetical protein